MKTFKPTDKELWEVLHPYIRYIGMNKYLGWFGFDSPPVATKGGYKSSGLRFNLDCLSIDINLDWRNSLTERPKE